VVSPRRRDVIASHLRKTGNSRICAETRSGENVRHLLGQDGGQPWKRAAAIMSLIQTAKLNGHDPNAYLKDVLQRLPTQRARDIGELLPHRWLRPDLATLR
jgi:hypothetical protein